MSARRLLSREAYVAGVLAGDRAALGRAITLVESTSPAHRALAGEVLRDLLPRTGGAHRVGISGAPGAGKSTFIARFGKLLTGRGHRVAVLAVDPSSAVTGGSILGDKTRMGELALDERAFIRPSPSGGTLGGVARRTREVMRLVEAAGFDVVLVETVGVGQSETVVADLVDTFLVLVLAGGGDELQGIKRGILEVVDVLAVTKADGDNRVPALRAQAEYASALRILRGGPEAVPVLATSAVTGEGLEAVREALEAHRARAAEAGALEARRRRQDLRWMWSRVEEGLLDRFRAHPGVQAALPALEAAVAGGTTPPAAAAEALLDLAAQPLD